MQYRVDPGTPNLTQHGIAAYPKEYLECHVSENKICVRFGPIVGKARLAPHDDTGLLKGSKNGRGLLPVEPHGTEFRCLAVGIPLQEHKRMLQGLIDAYREHIERFGPEMLEYLKSFQLELNEMLTNVKPNKDSGCI